MKYIAAILILSVCAAGQSVVLAPPDQQTHPTAHTGTFTAIYHPAVKTNLKPTVVLGSGFDEQNCYVTHDSENVPHSWCEAAYGATGRTELDMYLRNFHGANGKFTALLSEGSKCDPLRTARDGLIHEAVSNENKQITAAFDYQEKGRRDITVACTYTDSKGIIRSGTARYNII